MQRIYVKHKIKRGFKMVVAAIGVIAALGMTIPHTSYAYTEEEKAQAKAWLSAHGYSPDYGGASQAYQDYLTGQFDAELGITREETSETVSTEAGTGTESTESSTQTINVDEIVANMINGTTEGTTQTQEGSTELPGQTVNGTGTVQNGTESATMETVSVDGEENQTIQAGEKELTARISPESGMEQEETKEAEYITTEERNRAIIVVGIGMVCMLLLEFILDAFGKKKAC